MNIYTLRVRAYDHNVVGTSVASGVFILLFEKKNKKKIWIIWIYGCWQFWRHNRTRPGWEHVNDTTENDMRLWLLPDTPACVVFAIDLSCLCVIAFFKRSESEMETTKIWYWYRKCCHLFLTWQSGSFQGLYASDVKFIVNFVLFNSSIINDMKLLCWRTTYWKFIHDSLKINWHAHYVH